MPQDNSSAFASPSPSLTDHLGRWVEGSSFQRFVTALIVLNGISLGMETSTDIVERIGPLLHWFDRTVLAVFTFEILGKLFYRRIRFFRDGWNVFDMIIVAFALIPASGPLAVLRALRILRILRLVSVVPQLRRVIQALLTAIPGMASVAMIISLLFYVGAVLTTKLYGDSFPQWFGTIGESMYTLFQLMTLESWSMGIVRPVMEIHPTSWVFFVPFIIITSFAILNMFIGIIVDSMQTVHAEDDKAERVHETAEANETMTDMARDLRALRGELRDMRSLLDEKHAREVRE
ncbi:MAG: ion transporter [Rhodospirillum sp.]|nr:ion transporter [Rhodospirillum sp.]MCF8490124.1 ion transporter [Rhodospirillum sp.]MCF8501587.1 ion transporter [Rhodospirillum sp.]